MDNFDLKKYLAEGRLLKENKYDIDDPNSPLGQLNDNDQDVAILNNMTKKYGLDVVLMWMSSGEYGDREYFEEGKLYEEDNLKDYWSEWAAGEVEVGNDGVIDAGGVDADFKDVPDDTMDTFKRYVKAVKTLNASSKELRDDIAGAVSSILYDGGDFEDYSFDVLTADQFTKIQDII